MPRFRFVPNLTHQFPSKDHVYRTAYYPYFANSRNPRDLPFEGYFRAICIYGGEEELLRNGKVARSTVGELLLTDPTWANPFRRQAVQKGYSDPESSQIKFTVFWGRDYFDTTEDESVARQVYLENPQPNICFAKGHETIPVLESWPACPLPWTPAVVPGARTANRILTIALNDEDSDSSADAQDSSYESDLPENSEDSDTESLAEISQDNYINSPSMPATPGSAQTRNKAGRFANKEDETAHALAVVEAIFKATADLNNKSIDQAKHHNVVIGLCKKNPDVPEKLRSLIMGKDVQEMNVEEYTASLLQSAKSSSAKKRRLTEVDDSPVGPGILFPSRPKPDISAGSNEADDASTPSKAALEKIKEKDRLIDWHRYMGGCFRDNVASLRSRILPEELYFLNWGPDFCAVVWDHQGVIHYKLVADTLHKILMTMQDDLKSPLLDFNLLSIIGLLKSPIRVAEFSIKREKKNAPQWTFICDADDEELVKKAREHNIADVSWQLFSAFSFAQTKGFQALRSTPADDVLTWSAVHKSREDLISFLDITDEEYDDSIAAVPDSAKPKLFTTPKKPDN